MQGEESVKKIILKLVLGIFIFIFLIGLLVASVFYNICSQHCSHKHNYLQFDIRFHIDSDRISNEIYYFVSVVSNQFSVRGHKLFLITHHLMHLCYLSVNCLFLFLTVYYK
jgi:hypothetical protein